RQRDLSHRAMRSLIGTSIIALVVVVGGGGQAGAQTRPVISLLPQTRTPLPKGARFVGALPASTRLPITVLFKPRHAALLARRAGSGQAPLPPATIRALFDPTSAQV